VTIHWGHNTVFVFFFSLNPFFFLISVITLILFLDLGLRNCSDFVCNKAHLNIIYIYIYIVWKKIENGEIEFDIIVKIKGFFVGLKLLIFYLILQFLLLEFRFLF